MENLEFKLECGCIKRGRKWPIASAKVNVVIFEGMEEHVSRYDRFASYLNTKGIAVYGLDVFGQGDNVKEDLSNIGVWPENGFNKQLNHFNQFIMHLKQETGLPTFIFSHSMGSFYGQRYMEEYGENIDKYCLCGSGFNNGILGIAEVLAKIVVNKKNEQKEAKFLGGLMFSGFNKKIENPKTDYDWLSVNEENVKTYIADPLCGFGPRNRFCLEFIKFMHDIYKKKNVAKFNKLADAHVFLITGAEDPVSNYGKYTPKIKDMFNKCGIKDVSYKIYEGLRHEILNEDEWEDVAKDVADFFLLGL